MTEQRRAELEANRQQVVLAEEQRALQGAIFDGVSQIQAALSSRASEMAAAPIAQLVSAGKGAAKGKKMKVRG
jgi:hypothetical protein